MDWPAVLRAKVQDVEKEEALLEDLYTFFSNENLPHTTEDGSLLKLLSTFSCSYVHFLSDLSVSLSLH